MYLVDTNVISALAPSRQTSPEVRGWLRMQSSRMHLSSISIAEIESGIAKCRRTGALQKALNLTEWLETILHIYEERILPAGIEICRAAGPLIDLASAQGQSPGLADILIAATAQCHQLIILTRNEKHFVPLGVVVLNPFEGLR